MPKKLTTACFLQSNIRPTTDNLLEHTSKVAMPAFIIKEIVSDFQEEHRICSL